MSARMRWGRHVWAWVRMVRPTNSLAATALLLAGAWNAGQGWPAGTGWAALSLWSITAFGYTVNDILDLPADRVSKPHRPLVTGHISPGEAMVGAGCFAGVALGAGARAESFGWVAALVALVTLVLYSTHLKRVPLVGNVQIAAMAASALVAGAWLRAAWGDVLGMAGVVFFYILGREVLKTGEDVAGDQVLGARTVAVVWGVRAATWMFALCMVAAVFVLAWMRPSWVMWLLWTVPVLGLAGVVLFLPPAQGVRWGLRLTKVGYLAGIVALFLSSHGT